MAELVYKVKVEMDEQILDTIRRAKKCKRKNLWLKAIYRKGKRYRRWR